MDFSIFFNRNQVKLDVTTLANYANFSKEYIDFMVEYDVSNILSNDYKISFSKRDDYAHLICFLTSEEVIRTNEYYHGIEETKIIFTNEGFVIIGETESAIFVCIGVKENNKGKIYIYGWDFGIIRVDANLADFFNSLELNEDINSAVIDI